MNQCFPARGRLGMEKSKIFVAQLHREAPPTRYFELIESELHIAEPHVPTLQIEPEKHPRHRCEVAEENLLALTDHVEPALAQQTPHVAIAQEPFALLVREGRRHKLQLIDCDVLH